MIFKSGDSWFDPHLGGLATRSRMAAGRLRSLVRTTALFSSVLLATQAASAQEAPATIRNTYGEVGLLDMPSAHMAPDGQFGFNIGDIGDYQRYAFSFQRWPWLETSFRYSRIPDWMGNKVYYDRSLGAKARFLDEADDFADVSVGVRDILGTGVYGAEYLVASKHVGAFDVTTGFGWGRLAGNDVLPNPFGEIIPSFKVRNPPGTTGLVDFSEFFHGPKIGVFGGLAWQTPLDGLSLIAEYSSDKYTTEREFPGGLKVNSPVNFGASYQPYNFLSMSAGWFYGRTYGFTLDVTGDPTTTFLPSQRIGPDVPLPAIRSDAEQAAALQALHSSTAGIYGAYAGGLWVHVPTEQERTDLELRQALYAIGTNVRDIDIEGTTLIVNAAHTSDAREQCARYAQLASLAGSRIRGIAMSDLASSDATVTFCPVKAEAEQVADAQPSGGGEKRDFFNAVARDLIKQDIVLDEFTADKSQIWLYYENRRYREESEAIGRIVRVLMADAPPSIEIFHIVPTLNDVPQQEVTIIRSAMERTIAANGVTAALGNTISLQSPPMRNEPADAQAGGLYPRFGWSIYPHLSEHLFDPNRPLQFQLDGDLGATLQLAPGLTLATDLSGNIWNDLDFSTPPVSQLPHVRTDLLKYLQQGQYGISFLGAEYMTRLAPDVFAEAKAGYLEDMFMGGGGDILWRPEGSRLSVGADLYQVWKRDFNRLFGAQSYNILTGHITVYYESPWSGVNYALHMGRYLAGDYGATLEISRRFSTGVEIGAWATFTNVPFSKFGEGSFDKGIVIIIPFEWGLPIYSQSSYDLHLASLTRDGGQRLADDDSLYQETRGTSYGDISQHLDDMAEP